MVKIFYSTLNMAHNKSELALSNGDILYEKVGKTQVFVKDIIFEDQDSDKQVCLQTIYDENSCYYKTRYNLIVNEINL